MKKDAFRFWLSNNRRNATGASLDARTVSSRLSNCRTVERYEGDLDLKFDQDHLRGLLDSPYVFYGVRQYDLAHVGSQKWPTSSGGSRYSVSWEKAGQRCASADYPVPAVILHLQPVNLTIRSIRMYLTVVVMAL
jgi:hypothetical protein